MNIWTRTMIRTQCQKRWFKWKSSLKIILTEIPFLEEVINSDKILNSSKLSKPSLFCSTKKLATIMDVSEWDPGLQILMQS